MLEANWGKNMSIDKIVDREKTLQIRNKSSSYTKSLVTGEDIPNGMRVATITPAKNEEELIGRCLDSIVNQRLPIYRIFCVNHASTDRTQEIMDEYPVTSFYMPGKSNTNQHLSLDIVSIYNKLLTEALADPKVDFILFIGADTLIPLDYTEKIVTRMLKDSRIVLAGAGKCYDFENQNYQIQDTLPDTGKIYRTSFLKAIGGRYPLNIAYEDFLTYSTIVYGYKIEKYSDTSIFLMRETKENLSFLRRYRTGQCLRSLGYPFPIVIGKALANTVRQRDSGIALLRGYFDRSTSLLDKKFRKRLWDYKMRFFLRTIKFRIKVLGASFTKK